MNESVDIMNMKIIKCLTFSFHKSFVSVLFLCAALTFVLEMIENEVISLKVGIEVLNANS